MSPCRRNCTLGYLGTEEIRDESSNEPGEGVELTEGRISAHLEFMARLGQTTRVRLCPCQSRPEQQAARGIRGWRME